MVTSHLMGLVLGTMVGANHYNKKKKFTYTLTAYTQLITTCSLTFSGLRGVLYFLFKLSLNFHINNSETYTLVKSLSPYFSLTHTLIQFSNNNSKPLEAHKCVRAQNSILPNEKKICIIKHLLRGICLLAQKTHNNSKDLTHWKSTIAILYHLIISFHYKAP